MIYMAYTGPTGFLTKFHETTPPVIHRSHGRPRDTPTSMSRVVPLQQSIAGCESRAVTKPKKKAETCATVEVIWKRLNH